MNSEIANLILPEIKNWGKKNLHHDDAFSADHVIDAYEKGMTDDFDIRQKLLQNEFSKNVNHAANLGAELVQQIKALNIKCLGAFLRPKDINYFEILFVVEEKEFHSEKLDEAYKIARLKKKEVNNDLFSMFFSFMPYNKNINKLRLYADGYVLGYGKL